LTSTAARRALPSPYDSRTLSDGPHTLTAQVIPLSGPTQIIQAPFTVQNRPSVTATTPTAGATLVPLDTAIAAEVALPNPGTGVASNTLNPSTVQLYQTLSGTMVPGTVNTSAAGDIIVYQPAVQLTASTKYTFVITEAVTDSSGVPFIPYTLIFTTGTTTSLLPTPGVTFSKAVVYNGATISTLLIGPDGKLYAASLDGNLRRWRINATGGLTQLETYTGLAGRAIIGLTFDPGNPQVIWISHNDPIPFENEVYAADFTGQVDRLTLSGTGFVGTLQPYLHGLPRSAKDHLSNSLAFGPDGLLYLTQGSNSAMGAPDSSWNFRPERLFSAAVLQIDPRQTPPVTGFDVQTETYFADPGTYDPSLPNAVLKVYAAGVRNAYDLLWHSNGHLYIPTNGSAAGGNTPADPMGTVPAVNNVRTQDDWLFDVRPGKYYGHPNPLQGRYVLNGGNPTADADCGEVVAEGNRNGYPVGIAPDLDWTCPAHNFGRNRSPNGVIEYRSTTFGGSLRQQLLIAEYSAGDDIIAVSLNADGTVNQVTQAVAGLINPLDLVEDRRNGNLYVAELFDETGEGQITLLTPMP